MTARPLNLGNWSSDNRRIPSWSPFPVPTGSPILDGSASKRPKNMHSSGQSGHIYEKLHKNTPSVPLIPLHENAVSGMAETCYPDPELCIICANRVDCARLRHIASYSSPELCHTKHLGTRYQSSTQYMFPAARHESLTSTVAPPAANPRPRSKMFLAAFTSLSST